ncbi:alpha/beta hydrolase [Micromonospora sp. NPDC005305]|uniref:esterase/lipase family protein n=1 Tax=Micromonospora sp. NPDC005305 TaxID=3156875 RepID=UPI0033A2A552
MRDATLLFIHGFWSSPATWDRIASRLDADVDLAPLRIKRFGYRSPKLSLPLLPTRIPDQNDIAQDLASYIDHQLSAGPLAVVTHSQGGLILQRYLAWMVHEKRESDLARIELIVMLACPNEGSEYLRSIRRAAGFGRHPQARDLQTLSADVADTRRTVMHHVRIPLHAFSGSSDNVVPRASGQGAFQRVGSLPGDHFSILNPDVPGSSTVPVLKDLLVQTFIKDPADPQQPETKGPKYVVNFHGPSINTSVGDGHPNNGDS